jgi:hypothetical protein
LPSWFVAKPGCECDRSGRDVSRPIERRRVSAWY